MKEKWYDYWWFCLREVPNRKRIFLGERGLTGKDFFYIEEILKKINTEKWLTEDEIKNIRESENKKLERRI